MAKNSDKSSVVSYNTGSHDSLSANKLYGSVSTKPHGSLSTKFSPRSLTELAANKIEQSIRMPRLAKPKSLVQLAAEKIEQSIKQPAKLPKPSKLIPTLKKLAAKGQEQEQEQLLGVKINQ